MNPEQKLQKLYSLLGHAVLIPIPIGKKGPELPAWQNLTYKQAPDQALLDAATRGGNIGVLLGPASERLFTIDLDDNAVVEEALGAPINSGSLTMPTSY